MIASSELINLGFTEEEADKIINLPERFVKWEEFENVIHGKRRKICRPASPVLIQIHKLLHDRIFRDMPVSDFVAAFVVGKGVRYLVHKVARHRPNFLWRIDLKNFFDTVTKESLVSHLVGRGWSQEVSEFISGLVTYNGRVPIGGICSGEITNIILSGMHDKIAAVAMSRGIHYSAYADDLFFWGIMDKEKNDEAWDYIKVKIKEIIKDHGLMLNYKKIVRINGGPLPILGTVIINGVPYPTPASEAVLANMISRKLSGKHIDNRRISGMVSWLWSINHSHFTRVWKSNVKILMKEHPTYKIDKLFPREFRKNLTF